MTNTNLLLPREANDKSNSALDRLEQLFTITEQFDNKKGLSNPGILASELANRTHKGRKNDDGTQIVKDSISSLLDSYILLQDDLSIPLDLNFRP